MVRHPMYTGGLIMLFRHSSCARLVVGAAHTRSPHTDHSLETS